MSEQPVKTPLEDLRNSALEHYREASTAIHHWSGFVEAAIKAYNPEPSTPPVQELSEEWLTEKPDFTEDCILLMADILYEPFYRVVLIYSWEFEGRFFYNWKTLDGKHTGNVENLKAERYKIVSLVK